MRLPFSAIKIDRTLLFDICNDKKRAMFYQSIIETFHRMGYSIVSEGVETEEEMSLLSSWGVDMIQGYYFSRPLPVEELLKLLSM
jgi:EAL domain-containing protein (putative c-di-GMP-specific phosphodiesterase class I)